MHIFFKQSSGKRGFTLIEMIVVIAAIGILAAIGLPTFFDWLPNIRLRNASQNLLADMQRTKVEAIERGENVVIDFATVACAPPNIPSPGGTYTIFVDDVTVNNSLDAGETVVKQEQMPQDVGLCAETFAGTGTGFLPNGLLIGNNSGTATLRSTNGRTHTITVSAAGSLSLN